MSDFIGCATEIHDKKMFQIFAEAIFTFNIENVQLERFFRAFFCVDFAVRCRSISGGFPEMHFPTRPKKTNKYSRLRPSAECFEKKLYNHKKNYFYGVVVGGLLLFDSEI